MNLLLWLILRTRQNAYPHSAGEKTDAQRSEVTCPESHNWWEAEWEPRSIWLSKTLFFLPHTCESNITFFKRLEKTDNNQFTVLQNSLLPQAFIFPCFYLYMFVLTLMLLCASLGCHTTVAVLIQSVHQWELGIQMSKWPVAMCTITWWGQVGLTSSCTPGPHSSYAHPEPHAATEIRRQNKIPGLGLGAVLELSCPAAYVSVKVSPHPRPCPRAVWWNG